MTSSIYPQEHKGYLILKKISIENANTISGPLSYGFPALSGFVGAVHALSRQVMQKEDFQNLRLDGCVIACHDIQVLAYRENAYSNFTFRQTRNPILKDGSTASIIESGRCHLVVHLVIKVYGDFPEGKEHALEKCVEETILAQRIAGGSVISLDKKRPVRYVAAGNLESYKKELLPAFILMSAHQDLVEITAELQKENPENTALDALIETAALHHIPVFKKTPSSPEEGSTSAERKVEWRSETVKKGRGWLVPIPVGYQGIAPLMESGQLKNSRNPEYASQYVEAIYSLGKWVFPTNIDLKTAFWHHHYDAEKQLYLIEQI